MEPADPRPTSPTIDAPIEVSGELPVPPTDGQAVLDPDVPAGEVISHDRVARNAVVYFLSQLLSWSVTFLTVSIIPRRLGETAMGQYGISGTVLGTVSSFYYLSMESHLTVEAGRDSARGVQLLRALWGLKLLLYWPMAATVLLVLWAVHASPMIYTLAAVGLVSSLVVCFNNPVRAAMSGWEQAKRAASMDLVAAFAPLLAIPFLSHGPIALSLSGLSVSICVAAGVFVSLRRRMTVVPLFDRVLWKDLVLGGLPFMANGVVTQLYSFSSVFIVRHFAGDAAVGEYNQTTRLQGTFMFVPVALGYALLPALARMADTDLGQFRRIQSRILVLVVALGLPVAALVYMLAGPFCRLLYGPVRFQHVPGALQMAAINILPLYINVVMYRFLVAQRKAAVWSLFLAGTVALNAALACALVPLMQSRTGNAPAGALLSSLIAESATVAAAFLVLRHNPLNRETSLRLLKSVLATAAMVWVISLTRGLFIVVPALCGLLVFGVLAWFLRVLGDEEQDRLVGLVRSKLRAR